MSARPAWKSAFLATLRNTGNVRLSCAAAKVGRSTCYVAREKSPEFARLWDEALEDGVDVLEAEARKRALKSSDFLLGMLLKAHRPGVYGDRQHVAVRLTVDKEYNEDLDRAYGDGPAADD